MHIKSKPDRDRVRYYSTDKQRRKGLRARLEVRGIAADWKHMKIVDLERLIAEHDAAGGAFVSDKHK